MDFTPQPNAVNISEDSGCFTGSFDNSRIPFESTPNYAKTAPHSTPTSSLVSNTSRKRKISHAEYTVTRRLAEISEICPSPQFCSTLNESLVNNLEKCSITANFYTERPELVFEENPPAKVHKLSECKSKAHSAPATPIKQMKNEDFCSETSRAQSSYYKIPPVINESPYKETLDIIYPVKPTVPAKKSSTPQKYNFFTKRVHSPAKKRLFEQADIRIDPFKFFKGNILVISKIISMVSDKDLCRMRTVSKLWCEVVDGDTKTCERYRGFTQQQKVNKENRSYTPPDSPPSPDSPPVSPGRRQFHRWTKLAKELRQGQTMRKCLNCSYPSIVQDDISQCQNTTCGTIHCLKCDSFAFKPQDFYDRCQKSSLVLDKPDNRPRYSLSDLSNSIVDISSDVPSFLSTESASPRCETSGFVSESDSPISRVRRNLRTSFGEKSQVLSDHNKNVSYTYKTKRRSSLVPVVSNSAEETNEIVEPSSPPKVKNVAFSKQSKKNLKRLLR